MLEAMVVNYRHMSEEYGKRVGMDVRKIVTEDDVRDIATGLIDTVDHQTGVRGLWKKVESEINGRILASICAAGERMP